MVSVYSVVSVSMLYQVELAKLAAETLALLKDPDVKASLAKMGFEEAAMGPAELTTFYREEVKRYADLVKEFNIQAE